MSSKDFKLVFIVIKKLNLSPSILKNVAHHFLELWKAVLLSNVHGFMVTMASLKAHINAIKIRHHDLESIDIWLRYQAKTFSHNFHFRTSRPHFKTK